MLDESHTSANLGNDHEFYNQIILSSLVRDLLVKPITKTRELMFKVNILS